MDMQHAQGDAAWCGAPARRAVARVRRGAAAATRAHLQSTIAPRGREYEPPREVECAVPLEADEHERAGEAGGAGEGEQRGQELLARRRRHLGPRAHAPAEGDAEADGGAERRRQHRRIHRRKGDRVGDGACGDREAECEEDLRGDDAEVRGEGDDRRPHAQQRVAAAFRRVVAHGAGGNEAADQTAADDQVGEPERGEGDGPRPAVVVVSAQQDEERQQYEERHQAADDQEGRRALCRRVKDPLRKPLLLEGVDHLHASVTILVVELALARVGEEIVRAGNLVEALTRVRILVRVVPERKAICRHHHACFTNPE